MLMSFVSIVLPKRRWLVESHVNSLLVGLVVSTHQSERAAMLERTVFDGVRRETRSECRARLSADRRLLTQ